MNIPNYQTFGQKTTLRLNPDKVLNLHWELSTTLNTTPTLITQHSVMTSSVDLMDDIPMIKKKIQRIK